MDQFTDRACATPRCTCDWGDFVVEQHVDARHEERDELVRLNALRQLKRAAVRTDFDRQIQQERKRF